MINVLNYKKNLEKLNFYISKYSNRHNSCFGTPLVMTFLVTNKCTLKCKHCFYHQTISCKDSAHELSIDEYRRLSKSMDSFFIGVFCGGEPFSRNDTYEIINIFQVNNKLMTADATSNGQLTNQIVEQVGKIVIKSPHQNFSLGLSIDGFQDTHEEIRGKGTFEKVMQTWHELKLLKRHHNNFELYVCGTINKINEAEFPQFIEWCIANLKPDKISLMKIRQQPRAGAQLKNIDLGNWLKSIQVVEKHISSFDASKLEKPQTYLSLSGNNYVYDGEIQQKKLFKCYAGLHGGFVDYNGDIGVCEVLDPIANLRDFDMDFSKLWNSELAQKSRESVNSNNSCLNCTHEAEGILPSLWFEPNQIKYERTCGMQQSKEGW